jgi:hypothetical protein
MNGVVVIVVYRPKLGKANETVALVRSRVPTLRNEGLANRSHTHYHARTRRHNHRSLGMEIAGSNRCARTRT